MTADPIFFTMTVSAPNWITSNSRFSHWAQRTARTSAIRRMAHYGARNSAGRVPRVRGPVTVTARIAYPPGVHRSMCDPGNAEPAVKAMIDGLVDAGVWPDDNAAVIHHLGYEYDEAGAGRARMHRITLVVTPA